MLIEVILVAIVVIILFGLLCSIAQFHEFSKTGVKYENPLPYVGNLLKPLLGIEHLVTTMKRIYDSFPNERYVGIFEFFSTTIIVKDPELIKKITIKDFDHFQDVPIQIDEEVDSVFGRILLALKGNKWRKIRSKVSPVFTSSKMKNMFSLVTDCAERFVSYYEKDCSKHGGNIDLDAKDLTSRFTNDVIASTAFSLEINSLEDKNNYFYGQAALLSGQSLLMNLKFAGFRLFPDLMKKLGIPLLPANSVSYLKKIVVDTMNNREISGEYRPDLIHLLNEAKKGILKHENANEQLYRKEFSNPEETLSNETPSTIKLTDDDLLAQAIVFILAGFMTSSTLLSFLLYELSIHPEIQTKLREEVDEISTKNNGKVTYTDITHMKYMDMVVSETLRKWPPIPLVNRLCTKDYDLGPINEFSDKSIKIEKNNVLWIPIYPIHMDPEHWPNPMKFDPERFSDENKEKIKVQTYLPFGSGPRNCIGARFALMEIKVLIYYFLSKFEFNVCEKTPIPMTLSTRTLFFESKDGYWMNMKSRK